MATHNYISFNNLSKFLDNIKNLFATKIEVDAKSDKVHTHNISDISNLQTALDNKASSSHGTHVTYSTTTPSMNGAAAVGVATTVARSDHRHPTDSSRAAQTSLDSHTGNTTTHITSAERTNWNSAYTHSQSSHAPNNAEKNQNAFSYVKVGDVSVSADTVTDTLIIAGSNVTITPDATNDKITISVANGSTSAKGIVQLTDSTSSTSTTTAATPNSVKTVYDLANSANTAAKNAQTTADSKANASHTHTVSNISDLTATATELNYMDGVTSGVQAQLDGKAASSHNHSASNITSGTLSSDRLPTVSIAKGGTGATTAAGVLTNLGITATATELNYVDGVTSNIQTQLNGKSETSHTHSYLPLSGGTITGQLDTDKVFRNGNTFYNVLEFASTATVDEIVIKTKIPFISGNSMPLVHLKGYAYGESATIEMTVAFYIYSDKFTNMGVVSSCPWKPSVYLSSYTENNTKYVAISFAGSIYYPRFVIDYTDIWSGSSNRDYSSGWTSSNRASGTTTSIIPSADKVEVPYKHIANNISGNAATATNVAWSGVTSKPSYYDAKAIKSITRSGTTFTYTCMDGTTGTFTQQDNNTDTKVTNTLETTTKAYVTGTTSASTNTGTQVFDTGVYLDTTAGQLTATTFNGATFSGSGVATVAEVKTYLGID